MGAIIDPWSGMQRGTEMLQSLADTQYQKQRQAELDRMAREDWEFKKTERERTLADALAQREALAKASKPYDVTTPNPEYEKYLAAHTPEAFTASKWQKPSEDTLALEQALGLQVKQTPPTPQALSDLALAQGAAPEQTLTTKVTPHPLKAQVEAGRALAAQGNPLGMAMMSAAQKSLHDELASVVAIGDLDAAAKLYTDVSGVPTSATPKGQLKIETKDGVTTIVDGATLQRLVNKGIPLEKAAEASVVSLGDTTKKEYLQRQRPEGRNIIFEESRDNGKTWREVSRGEKDKPTIVMPSYRREPNLPPGYMYNSKTGEYYKTDPTTGKPRPLTATEAQNLVSESLGFQQERAAARTSGGARSMMTNAAYDQFTTDAKALVDLSSKVDEKLVSKALPILGNSVSIKEAEIKLKKQFGDTDSAKYFSKALATAEALGNALSGSGGSTSDFKLRLAQDLVRYGYDPETLQGVLDTHGASLKAKATSMTGFGKKTQAANQGVGNIPAGAKSITGPNGQKGYMLNGKAYTMDGKEIK